MTYTIESLGAFKAPYYNTPDEPAEVSTEISRHEGCSEATCRAVLKDIFDPPEAELTLDMVEKEFSSPKYPVTKDKLEKIVDYYNGRAKLYNKMTRWLETAKPGDSNLIDIPAELNQFTTVDEPLAEQVEAYIKVTVKE